MKIIKSIFVTLLLFTAFWASAQSVSVKGCVKDSATGEPIPFASIQLKGTMTGGSTDLDGNYTMNVPSDAVLVFSSIGYVSVEEAVNGRGVVDVALAPDTQMLEETVVVAFEFFLKARLYEKEKINQLKPSSRVKPLHVRY